MCILEIQQSRNDFYQTVPYWRTIVSLPKIVLKWDTLLRQTQLKLK